MKRLISFLLIVFSIYGLDLYLSGCAQIIAPTGGPRDSIPPKLVSANPKNRSLFFTVNRITLNFDEYIQLQDVRQNLIVSPTPRVDPYIDYKLKTVIIKLKDSLIPNTTYTINLGNSIRDINENNAINNFTYVFSTGSSIDSMEFSGNVQLAETGKVDSAVSVFLYRNLNDSAVIKLKPIYIARLDGQGRFSFSNLAPGIYKVYALKEVDGSKTYNNKTELFAFSDSPVVVNRNTKPVSLFAYAEEKEKPKQGTVKEKVLRYTSMVSSTGKQDLLTDLDLEFNKPLKSFDKQKLQLSDSSGNRLNPEIIIDSISRKISIKNKWIPEAAYKLVIPKDFAADSSGVTLTKTDTIKFRARAEADYGIVKLKFSNFDKSRNPVLQFFRNDQLVMSFPLSSDTWNAPLFPPGEFDMRILYDDNKNGKWDPGNFTLKKQPERVYSIPQKLAIRENFEKQVDIELPKTL